ncbi:MAG: hypothetical protein NXI01_06320 [Gammaproteobacteria bacterium]|nr:hypothetical protein [Gammaproteobacteria bacterium]
MAHHSPKYFSSAAHDPSVPDTKKQPTISKAEQKLIRNLGLSHQEFERYKKLNLLSQTKITELLSERKRLNQYVGHYLEEKINRQFAVLLHFLFPSEHNLRYALKKVDDIERKINLHLHDDENNTTLFDNDTTKINRLEILLSVAKTYQETLKDALKSHPKSKDTINPLEHRIDDLEIIIEELKLQIKTGEFCIHNKDILVVKDTDLAYFLTKMKAIDSSGISPKTISKSDASPFSFNILTAIYQHFYPNPTATQDLAHDDDEEEEDLDENSNHSLKR